MTHLSKIWCRAAFLSLLAALSAVDRSHADVVFYGDLNAFEASSRATLAVTFAGFTPANTEVPGPITLDGVTFTSVDSVPYAPNLIVATPTGPYAFPVPLQSNALTTTGNEHFALTFSSPASAVGFDTYTNFSIPPVVSVYDTAGNLIAQDTLTQAPETLGFIGVVSTIPIGKVVWLATDGGVQNTAIADIRIAGESVPEPSSLMLMGIAAVVATGRYGFRRIAKP